MNLISIKTREDPPNISKKKKNKWAPTQFVCAQRMKATVGALVNADQRPDRAVVGCLRPAPRIVETRLLY
jgi:hypothetical protein